MEPVPCFDKHYGQDDNSVSPRVHKSVYSPYSKVSTLTGPIKTVSGRVLAIFSGGNYQAVREVQVASLKSPIAR